MGALVITLPAQYLGSRWTLAFYSIIGVTDLVASSKEDYVRLAVEMGTSASARESMRSKLSANLHKLYQREEAIDAWIQTLLRIAGWPDDEEHEQQQQRQRLEQHQQFAGSLGALEEDLSTVLPGYGEMAGLGRYQM